MNLILIPCLSGCLEGVVLEQGDKRDGSQGGGRRSSFRGTQVIYITTLEGGFGAS